MDDTRNTQALAEPQMPKVEPRKEHRWLQQLVGEWTYETRTAAQPGQAALEAAGTESVRSIGDLWIVAEGQGEMPGGGEATTLLTLGFDEEKKRFVGTWIGSMMTHLWSYDGQLDQAERILTLDSVGPTMAGDGKTTRYQDVIELRSDSHRTLTARILAPDGTWQQLMTVDYRRR